MWRHDDLFRAALGGGNPGGPPLTSSAEVAARAREGGPTCLPASPLFHGTALWTALTTLLTGGCLVLDGSRFDAAATWDLVVGEGVSWLSLVGDAFARPLADVLVEHPHRWEPQGLTLVLSGGAVLSPSVRDQLLASLPWVAVVDSYGASETGGQGRSVFLAGSRLGSPTRFTVGAGTAVLDTDLRPLPPGASSLGYLARRGPIPLGYWNDAEATAATFVEIDGERWAVPGDIGRHEADGTVTLLGRGSLVINSGGEKVWPDEVEAELKAHPDVFDAVVAGVPDPRWGEQVGAMVQLRPGRHVAADALVRHCRARLAPFKVPRRVVLVDGPLPRHPSGKADYGVVRVALRGAPAATG